ncbi:MAG TPA: flagellar biosynthetic protein FliO [Myxococcaceae bacterium]|nr:flagellar biosynthetic protein FliO [Myxococcaceae bacterium]
MKTLLASVSPRNKVLLAAGLVLGLAALAPVGGMSTISTARGLLGAAALAGLGVWLMRRGRSRSRFVLAERMRVVSRTGLSPRCGLALVEVDGRDYLVAFGDSFAEIHRTRGRARPARLEKEVLP